MYNTQIGSPNKTFHYIKSISKFQLTKTFFQLIKTLKHHPTNRNTLKHPLIKTSETLYG